MILIGFMPMAIITHMEQEFAMGAIDLANAILSEFFEEKEHES
jgi:hypothetical protein